MALLAFLQLTASVLNLLPVPGLDGGNMIYAVAVARQWQRAYNLLAPYGFILLFVLLWQPRINRLVLRRWSSAIGDAIGLPSRPLRARLRPDPLLAA